MYIKKKFFCHLTYMYYSVLQSDTLAPFLFVILLDWVL